MAAPTRQQVEDFLFDEAAMLDAWQLDDWLKLFRADAMYLIPALDSPDKGPQDALSLVLDDMKRLTSRAHQFTGRAMWAESPVSRTRRLITNVRIVSAAKDQVHVTANFAVYYFRHEKMVTYVGRYEHKLAITDDGFQFIERKAVLDLECLNPHGKISIIL